jgi:glycine cleavage system pyridoxal-binding protein P
MNEGVPRKDEVILAALGHRTLEDFVAAELPHHFHPREVSTIALPEGALRHELQALASQITPASRAISLLGRPRLKASPRLERKVPLQKFQEWTQALTGLVPVGEGVSTQHEAWVAAVELIKRSRPGRPVVHVADTFAPSDRFRFEHLLARHGLEYRELVSIDGVIVPASVIGVIDAHTAAVLIPSPNAFGYLEATSELGQLAHQQGALFGVVLEALSLLALRTPAAYRANFALLDWSHADASVRPGLGRVWSLTVQERLRDWVSLESCASAARALVERLESPGPLGIAREFKARWEVAHYLANALVQIAGCRKLSAAPFVDTFVVQITGQAEALVAELEDQGVLLGFPLHHWGLPKEWLKLRVHAGLTAGEIDYVLRAFRSALARYMGRSLSTDY